jgi:hypothetical protein
MLVHFQYGEHKMTKQIERIFNVQTGEVTERELTQAEIAQLATADPHAEQSTPIDNGDE